MIYSAPSLGRVGSNKDIWTDWICSTKSDLRYRQQKSCTLGSEFLWSAAYGPWTKLVQKSLGPQLAPLIFFYPVFHWFSRTLSYQQTSTYLCSKFSRTLIIWSLTRFDHLRWRCAKRYNAHEGRSIIQCLWQVRNGAHVKDLIFLFPGLPAIVNNFVGSFEDRMATHTWSRSYQAISAIYPGSSRLTFRRSGRCDCIRNKSLGINQVKYVAAQ